jgi:hypothetical protein
MKNCVEEDGNLLFIQKMAVTKPLKKPLKKMIFSLFNCLHGDILQQYSVMLFKDFITIDYMYSILLNAHLGLILALMSQFISKLAVLAKRPPCHNSPTREECYLIMLPHPAYDT